MLTWEIVKTGIDSSLNLYEHCVACDDENNCPAGRALQPCGANPAEPLTACRGVKTPRKAVYSHILSQRWPAQCARRLFTSPDVPQRQNKRFLAYFGGVLAVPWNLNGRRKWLFSLYQFYRLTINFDFGDCEDWN